MGNFMSQCVAAGSTRPPLVVLADGSRLCLEELSAVAELMIDAPGHVVVRARDARKQRRLRALPADELLQAGEVYLLVPASREGARLGDREVEDISRLVSGKKGGSRSGRRIFPDAGAEEEDVDDGEGTGFAGKAARGMRPRQWTPALDTIHEV